MIASKLRWAFVVFAAGCAGQVAGLSPPAPALESDLKTSVAIGGVPPLQPELQISGVERPALRGEATILVPAISSVEHSALRGGAIVIRELKEDDDGDDGDDDFVTNYIWNYKSPEVFMWFIIVVIVLGCCVFWGILATCGITPDVLLECCCGCCPTPDIMCLGIAAGITCCWCFFLCEPDCSRKNRNKRDHQLSNVQLTQPGNHLAQQQGVRDFTAAGEQQQVQQPQIAVAVSVPTEPQLANAHWDNSATNGVVKKV